MCRFATQAPFVLDEYDVRLSEVSFIEKKTVIIYFHVVGVFYNQAMHIIPKMILIWKVTPPSRQLAK